MKKWLLCVLALGFVVIGCDKTTKNKPLEFELKEYEKSSTLNCSGENCTEIELHIPIVTNEKSEIADKINQSNLNFINNIVSLGDTLSVINNYTTLVDHYISDYEDFVKKYPDEDLPWRAEVKGDISCVGENILSFSFEYYTFAGGAHGFKSEVSQNFNPKTGELYSVQTLIKDWSGLQNLLFTQLKNKKDLFDKVEQLEYPESIFFYEDSIAFLYNAFDLETFHDGPIKLEYPKSEILPFLNITLEDKVIQEK